MYPIVGNLMSRPNYVFEIKSLLELMNCCGRKVPDRNKKIQYFISVCNFTVRFTKESVKPVNCAKVCYTGFPYLF